MRTRGLLLAAAATAAALLAAVMMPVAGHAADADLPWLHIEHPADGSLPFIADAHGRTVLLRGANASGFEDDFIRTDGPQQSAPYYPEDPAAYDEGACPANSHQMGQPPLCEIDFSQMRALGFDAVRLTISWSRIEPQPGVINHTYLDRIEQVVRWAKDAGIYVIVDLHQDAYSRFIDLDPGGPTAAPVVTATPGSPNHNDGAPAWAVVTDGQPALGAFGVDFTNARTEGAFTSFWLDRAAPDGVGLQEHYVAAVQAVAQRVGDDPTVAGIEVMNEPLPGYVQEPAFSTAFLYPFYAKVLAGLRALHDRHLLFFEPMAVRNLVDASAQASIPWTDDPDIVFAPHVYTHVFTVDTVGGNGAPYPTSYDQAYDTAAQEATRMHAALWVGEYGNSSDQDDTILRQETAAQERHLVGSTVWPWKGNCAPGDTPARCANTWSIFVGDTAEPPAANLGVKPTRLQYLSRAYPEFTAGRLASYRYDPDTRTFTMTATGGVGQKTVVFVPAAATGAVTATNGAAVEVVAQPDGTRLALVEPVNEGAYTVSVG